MRTFVRSLACVCVVGLLATSAKAGVLMNFAYTSLDGGYDGATGNTFTAKGRDSSSGFVKREVTPVGTTAFVDVNTLDEFDVILSMAITNVTGQTVGSTADGDGTFTFTDTDGDTIGGNLSGQWTLMATGSVTAFVFVGSMSQIFITAGDGSFDGTTSGSFDTDFSGFAVEPYNGFLVDISVDTSGDGWFDNVTYSNANANPTGSIIPAPGAVLLGMLGMSMVAAWRRKRAV